MNVDELINNYFNLSVDEKEELLCVLIKDYFKRNIEQGFSVVDIINGVDEVITYSINREDYEFTQAFVDIKQAMKIAIKEMNLDV